MFFTLRNNFFVLIAVSTLMPVMADAATLRVIPSTGSVSSGETISVAVTISSSDQAMNAAEGVVTFPTNLLQVVSVSKSGSVLGLWVQEPTYSNTVGTVNFEGIALNPGYTGSNGTVLTITFRARAEGSAPLSIADASVLANDGNGTEILTSSSGGTISIVAPQVKPLEKPMPVQVPKTQKKVTPAPEAAPETILEEPILTPAVSAPTPKTTIEKPFDMRKLLTKFSALGAPLILLLIVVFLILDGFVLYHYLRLRKRSGGELDHAQVMTHRSFLLLRDTVEKFVNELEEESIKRKLSPIEARFVKEMRADLSIAEKTIVKELRNAEKNIE